MCRAFGYNWDESGRLGVMMVRKLTALLAVLDAEDDHRMIERFGSVHDSKLFKKVIDRSRKIIDWIKSPISKKDFKMPTEKEWNDYKNRFSIWRQYALDTQDQAIKSRDSHGV